MSEAAIADSPANEPESKLPPTRWTLGDAFFLTTILCVLFAVIGWVGPASPFLWLSLIVSLVLTGLFTVMLPRQRNGCLLQLAIVFGIAFFGPLMIFSLVIVMNCALHLVLLIVLGRRDPPCNYKTVLKSSLVCLAVSFFAGSLVGLPGYQELKAARKKFAPVSLAGRLDYETEASTKSEQKKRIPFRWREWESEQGQNRRYFFSRLNQLERLHDRRVESFIKSSGFGVARMMYPSPARMMKESEPPTIGFHEVKNPDRSAVDPWVPQGQDFETMHVASAASFLNEQRFGVATESGERIGFVPHASFDSPIENDFTDDWQLDSLRLVSVERFDVPKVYVLDHLPRMEDLSGDDAPIRDLNDFETGALEKLREGQAFVARQSKDGSQMVALGPLLAIDSCLECHAAGRGDLLGAFTYEFRRRESDGLEDPDEALIE